MALNVRSFFELVRLLLLQVCCRRKHCCLSSPGAPRARSRLYCSGGIKSRVGIAGPPSRRRTRATGNQNQYPRARGDCHHRLESDSQRRSQISRGGNKSPLRRLIRPEEVARVARFLCSPAATGVNGHTLVVDGGAASPPGFDGAYAPFIHDQKCSFKPFRNKIRGEKRKMENLLIKVQGAFKTAFDVEPQSITIETKPSDIPAWDSMGHIA